LVGALQVPFERVDDDEKLQATDPIGIGMDDGVLDCHIRYIVAPNDLVIELYGRGAKGASLTGCPYFD
jgi:hypothetical protein